MSGSPGRRGTGNGERGTGNGEREALVRAPVIATSSGSDVLDAQAVRMVGAAAPFPPLPVGVGRRSLELVVPVRFRLVR